MEDENYKLLLEKLESFNKQIEDLKTQVKDVTAFNRELLNSHSNGTPKEKDDTEELWKNLKEGLRHGRSN